MEFKALAEKLGLEEDEFLELVELYIETCSSDMLKLESAVQQGNIQRVVELSHTLKGSSGNLGFMDIFEKAKEIEAKARENIIDGAELSIQSIKGMIEQISQDYESKKN
jgi:HPt (histidine-containing phosphotransfer) domain-containing protein